MARLAALVVLACASACDRVAPADPSGDFARFDAWATHFAAASSAERARLLPEGEALAKARRRSLLELIKSDPARALRRRLPPWLEHDAPPQLARHLEQRVSGVGSLGVLAQLSIDPPSSAVERWAYLDGRSYRASVFGRRLLDPGVRETALSGVALDGWIALEDRAPSVVLARPALPPGWTVGPKTVLFMRLEFPDSPGDPIDPTTARLLIDSAVSSHYFDASYGRTTLQATVTPLLRLPHGKAWYENAGSQVLRDDARVLAAAAGFDDDAFDLDLVAFQNIGSWADAFAWVGQKGAWLNGHFSFSVTAHELGHNYGLMHANFWDASAERVIGAGTNLEYGNPFDLMGRGSRTDDHFNAQFKSVLGWVPPAQVQRVSSSGTWRLYELEALTTGPQAIEIPRADDQLAYWLELRGRQPTPPSATAGTLVNQAPVDGNVTELLDMTPWNDRTDSALVPGRTFSDWNSAIHVTPVARGGSSPGYLDVVVNLGAFPGNRAPSLAIVPSATSVQVGDPVVFTATASDPDGDPLAFDWQLDDGTLGPNAATATHAFTTAREYRVRCTVSDMKGGSTSRSTIVSVGAPTANHRLSGLVTLAGQPLAGARISASSGAAAFTDSDGTWTLVEVPAGSQQLSASLAGYLLTPAFSNPVTVSGNLTNLTFTAVRRTFQITGSVTAAQDQGLGGVTVTDGTASAVSLADGGFTLGGLSEGFKALTASKPGYAFTATGQNPVEVLGGDVDGIGFVATGQTVSGVVVGASSPSTVTDGYRSTTTVWSGNSWRYLLETVPNGSFTLAATGPGLSIGPANFTNPVTIADAGLADQNFLATNAGTFTVSGTVTLGGAPLDGVEVSDGARLTATGGGQFALTGVPAGTFTLTPARVGHVFTPPSRTVTVGGNVTGVDFTASVSDHPPTVAVPLALSQSVVTGASVTASVLGADDSGEANLRYFWMTTAGPSSVTASDNGSNAAKNVTLTFLAPGTYTIRVAILDMLDQQADSTATVTVVSTLSAVTVFPGAANVVVNASRQFSAAIKDQFGAPFPSPPAITWSVPDGGTIDAAGLFTAGGAVGGPFAVSAAAGGHTGRAPVTVTGGVTAPTLATPASAAPSPVTGTTTTVSVLGADDGTEANLTYTWQATGPAPVTFAPNGTNASKVSTATFTRAGSYVLEVWLRDVNNQTVSSFVVLEVNPTLSALTVAPGTANVPVRAIQLFTASATDQFGGAIAAIGPIDWSVTGGGSISPAGAFTAGSVPGGPFAVTAAAQGKTASAEVLVLGRAPVVAVPAGAFPSTVSGVSTRLRVLGADEAGEDTLSYRWASASGPSPVGFEPNDTNAAKSCTATFTAPGSYRLEVTITNRHGLSVASAADVEVVTAATRLVVTPASATVASGEAQQFTAGVSDQFGVALAPVPSISWSVAGGGSITEDGLFTASAPGGPYVVSASSGELSGTATVMVERAATGCGCTSPASNPLVVLGLLGWLTLAGRSARRAHAGERKGT